MSGVFGGRDVYISIGTRSRKGCPRRRGLFQEKTDIRSHRRGNAQNERGRHINEGVGMDGGPTPPKKKDKGYLLPPNAPVEIDLSGASCIILAPIQPLPSLVYTIPSQKNISGTPKQSGSSDIWSDEPFFFICILIKTYNQDLYKGKLLRHGQHQTLLFPKGRTYPMLHQD